MIYIPPPKNRKQDNNKKKSCFLHASLALVKKKKKKKHVPTQVHSGPPPVLIPIESPAPSATQFTKKTKTKLAKQNNIYLKLLVWKIISQIQSK